MNKKAVLLLAILLFSFIPLVSSDTEWFNSSFQYRNVYAIDSSLVDEELYNFPVLIYLNSSYISWDRVNDNLSDLRFYNISNNLLSHEIDFFIENDYAYIWVKIPYINNISDTYFFMYYGCFYAENIENKTGVWDENFVIVQHMNDETTSTILDSTIYDNDGTKKGVNEPIEADGQIGKAQNFDGTDDYISGASSPFDFEDTTFTVEVWFKTDTVASQGFVSEAGIGFGGGWCVGVNANGRLWVVLKEADGTTAFEGYGISTTKALDGELHKATFIVTTSTVDAHNCGAIFWLDDILEGNAVLASYGDNPYGKTISNWRLGMRGQVNPLTGLLDEIRILEDTPSASWVGASYEAQTLNLISLENTEFYNTEYLAFSIIAIVIALFSFVMVITIKEKNK